VKLGRAVARTLRPSSSAAWRRLCSSQTRVLAGERDRGLYVCKYVCTERSRVVGGLNALQIAFSEHINHSLGKDEYLSSHKYVPMSPEEGDLFKAVADGILLR